MSIQFRQRECVIEYSEDNGVTWSFVADISQCFEDNINAQPGEELRCAIATYLTLSLEQAQNAIITGVNSTNNDILTASQVLVVYGAFGSFVTGGIAAAVIGAVGVLAAIIRQLTTQAFSNALTPTFYDSVKFQLFCVLPDNGNLTEADINAWANNVRSNPNTNADVANAIADYIV